MKSKKTRRQKLIAETEKRQKKFYQRLPCVVCKAFGVINTNTCGHHIVPKGRCRIGRHRPGNIMPLCLSHHTMGSDMATESTNTLVVARFVEFMKARMPKRWEVAQALEKENKQRKDPNGSTHKMTIAEIEEDHRYWEAIYKNGETYEDICANAGVEAWAGKGASQ